MKKLLLSALFVLVLAGTSSASTFYGDPSQLYGEWTGSIVVGDTISGYSLTIGDDATAHDPDNLTDGYFYLPSSFVSSSDTYTILGSTPEATYTTIINNGMVDTITYIESAVNGWYTFLTLIFNTELDELNLTGFTYDLSDGSSESIGAHLTRATPIPGAVWLLASGLVGLVGLRRKDQI